MQWALRVRHGTCWHTGRTLRVLRGGVLTTHQMRLWPTPCIALPSRREETSSQCTSTARACVLSIAGKRLRRAGTDSHRTCAATPFSARAWAIACRQVEDSPIRTRAPTFSSRASVPQEQKKQADPLLVADHTMKGEPPPPATHTARPPHRGRATGPTAPAALKSSCNRPMPTRTASCSWPDKVEIDMSATGRRWGARRGVGAALPQPPSG